MCLPNQNRLQHLQVEDMPKQTTEIYRYEGRDFYNDYCSNLDDFTLLENFEDKNNEYVGKIAPNDTIYPIEIEVHIPCNFPHRKMLFVTSSISGYPHLIPFDRSNSYEGSWFCLNSAFAETPKEQLDEEFNRLRGWFQNNLRPDLPRHIKNRLVQSALQLFNAYEGANPDEVNEITEKSQLTFVGDFAYNRENFKEDFGYLNVVRHKNDKFTVFLKKEGTNRKLPYVLVSHFPQNINSFSSWADEFKWDKDLYKKLLPDFKMRSINDVQLIRKNKDGGKFALPFISDEEAVSDQKFLTNILEIKPIQESHKNALKKKVDDLVESNKRLWESLNQPWGYMYEDDFDPEEYMRNYNSNFHHFAVGLLNDSSITWYILTSNLNSREYEEYHYDFDRYTATIKEVVDIKLWLSTSKVIKREEYFGRGELSPDLSNMNIAIVGLGAIGSLVAESLARGGAQKLTLWDGDIVEAGNICRSIYDNADIGNAKAQALSEHIKRISPFCNVKAKGCWNCADYTGVARYSGGDFYGNINYESQARFLNELNDYDIIIDCTASNELLHFLSYAASDIKLLSLCITNKATHLLCFSNHEGNPFEMRKHFLSSIEQDTKNFYTEGTGCYSPTFLATGCDIQSLVNLCVRSINRQIASKGYVSSTIWHYSGDNVVADTLRCYQLDNSPITMVVSENSIRQMKKLPMMINGNMGFLLGGYNRDRDEIYVTSVIDQQKSDETIGAIYQLSNGIVDYIGNVWVASHI